MRYSKAVKRILSVSLACVLCITMFAQSSVFWGLDSDDNFFFSMGDSQKETEFITLGSSGEEEPIFRDEPSLGESQKKPGLFYAIGNEIDFFYTMGVRLPSGEDFNVLDTALNFVYVIDENWDNQTSRVNLIVTDIKVVDEAGEDITASVNTHDEGTDGYWVRSPVAGVYYFWFEAEHPGTGEIINTVVDDPPSITVFQVGTGDAYVSLTDRSSINLGSDSYINLTASLDTASMNGRYIKITAEKDWGLKFNPGDIIPVDGVESIQVLDDGLTLLLTLDSTTQSVITMDFPVNQTIDEDVARKLKEDTEFTFTAALYTDLAGIPIDTDIPAENVETKIKVAEYQETTLFIPEIYDSNTKGNEPVIENYEAIAYTTGSKVTPYIDKFRIAINKNTGMRPSYGLELVIPLHPDLVPVPVAGATVEPNYNGTGASAYVLSAEYFKTYQPDTELDNRSWSGTAELTKAMLDPNASWTYASGRVFEFTPEFSNLGSLGVKEYKAANPITLRYTQYGEVEEQKLNFTYSLEIAEFNEPQLTYYVTPAQVLQMSSGEMTFRPEYPQKVEPIYTDLSIEYTFPHQIQPQSIKLEERYGGATISYTIEKGQLKQTGSFVNNGNTYYEYKYERVGLPQEYKNIRLEAGDSWKFELSDNIPIKEVETTQGIRYVSLERVTSITVTPDRLDTGLASKGLHFTLTNNYANTDEKGGNMGFQDAPVYIDYTMKSANFSGNEKSDRIRVGSNGEVFYWGSASFTVNQYSSLDTSGNGSRTGNYYLDNRQTGDVPVSYLRYSYQYFIGPQTFTWELDFSGQSGQELMKSLTGVMANPGSSDVSTIRISSFTLNYSTAKRGAVNPVTYEATSREYAAFEFDGKDDYLTALTVEFTTTDWTFYGKSNYATLFVLYADLYKYEEVTNGAKWSSITNSNHLLTFNNAFENLGNFTNRPTGGYTAKGNAGTFYNEKKPQMLSGDYVTIAQSKTSMQGGADIQITMSRFLTSHKENESAPDRPYDYASGERVTLNGVTTYIPIDKTFSYVPDSLKVSVPLNNQDAYQPGDLDIGSITFRPATENDSGWLVIYWNTFTTGGQADGLYKDDPVITFTLNASPLMESGRQTVIPDYIYNDVDTAMQLNDLFRLTGFNNNIISGSFYFGESAQTSYARLTKGTSLTTVQSLAAARYGVELYGKIGTTVYSDKTITYYNDQTITGLVKMNYYTLKDDGKESAVVYIEIPQATSTHTGLRLAGPVTGSRLPDGSSIAYTTEPNPTKAMLTTWDESLDEEYFASANYSAVTAIRIIGIDLDQTLRQLEIPLVNRWDKDRINDQNISLDIQVQYKNNPEAKKYDSVTWVLTDYLLKGVFWYDAPKNGVLTSDSERIGGTLTARSTAAANPYATVTVTTGGYTAKIPAYGQYELTALAANYKSTIVSPDNGFVDGRQTLMIDSNHSLVVNAGFTSDGDKADEVIVVFVSNGGTEYDPLTLTINDTIPKPSDPVKEGSTFSAWYEGEENGDRKSTTPWNFSAKIPEQYKGKTMYLVAWWDEDATSIEVGPIDFGTHDMAEAEELIYRKDPVELDVKVTARPGGWALTVECTEPFTATDGDGNKHVIANRGALVLVKNNSDEYALDYAVLVDSDTLQYKEIHWDETHGILYRYDPDDVPQEGEYQATLRWTINSTP